MPDLYKRKGSVNWHFDCTVDGKRHRKSTKTTDRRIAEDFASKFDNELRRAAVYGEEAILTFPQALKLYVGDGGDKRFTVPLLDHFSKWKVKDITGPVIRSAAKTIYPNASAATWNRQVVTPMRAIINHTADAKGTQKISVKRFPEVRKVRAAGNKAWLDVFYKTAKRLNMPETAAAARFMFETATRVSEACRLTWDDVSLQERHAFLTKTKTEPRKVFLTRAMVIDLANIRNLSETLVFGAANRSTIKKRFDKVIKAAGLVRLTSHEIGRHGFATEMIRRNGVDVATTADHGGWKSRRLLMETYVEGDADREVIDRVFGKK
ncbi:phage integrase family protein [Agrobacterium rhizogenes]|nr:phage integrase family protein [Rhizobium rhizogenes]NTF73964.1 phage integrase family protein [Rhizobium rhizogenes]